MSLIGLCGYHSERCNRPEREPRTGNTHDPEDAGRKRWSIHDRNLSKPQRRTDDRKFFGATAKTNERHSRSADHCLGTGKSIDSLTKSYLIKMLPLLHSSASIRH